MKNILMTLIGLSIAYVVHGQAQLKVIVSDYEAQDPIEGVEVRLIHEGRSMDLSEVTDKFGIAHFKELIASGGYQIYVPAVMGYQEMYSGVFELRSNQQKSVNIDLVSSITVDIDAVQVVAKPTTQINRQNAEVSFELSEDEIEAIPVEGRDVTRILYRLPNVSQATGFYPEAPNVSINGANSLFTNYLIDGMDNNERFLGGQKFNIPAGFVQNIAVMANNFGAEYGNTANGIINITTKSGTNDLHGEAFFVTRPGPSIDGQSDFAQRDLSGNSVKDGFQRYQAGFGVGGPILRDRLFYYLNYEHTTDLKDNLLNSPELGVNETVRGTNSFDYLSAKLDQVWNKYWRSSLRLNLGLVNIERQGGGLDGGVLFPSAGNSQDRNSLLLAWNNTYVKDNFSSQTNVQYSRFRWNYGKPVNPNQSQVRIQGPSGMLIGIVGGTDFVFDQRENTIQLQQKLNWYLGRHRIKTGVEVISSNHLLYGGRNVHGNYTISLTEEQMSNIRNQGIGADLDIHHLPTDVQVDVYEVELRPNEFGDRQTIFSAYFEDHWTITDRTNLTIGLRYDYDDLTKAGSGQGDLNNLGPRININHRLGRRGALRFGYGLYYDKIPYAVHSDALQQNTNSDAYRRQLEQLVHLGILPQNTNLDRVIFDGNFSATISGVPFLGGPAAEELAPQRESTFSNERRILNPNGLDNPYNHQLSIGYQLQLDDHQLFYVDLMYNRSYNLIRLRNLNAPAPYPIDDPQEVVVRSTRQADESRPIPIIDNQYAIIDGERLEGVSRNIVMTETGGESEYYAMSLNYQKERSPEDKYDFRLNYTLSKLENNTSDINFRAMDANRFDEEWGPSINDRRHIINAIYNYYPLDRLVINIAGLIQSGQPINRIPDAREFGTTDLNGDGSFFGDDFVGNSDRYPGESRNNDRLPWSNTFDLGLSYRWPIAEGNLELRGDVFNVFNAQNMSGYSNNATQSNQIQAGSKASGVIVRRNSSAPRQFQFSLRYIF